MKICTPKKRFTQEQFEQAIAVPLVPFMEQRGYKLKRVGNEFRLVDHDSFVISNNLWQWNSRQIGGNVLSLLTKVEGMDMVEAVLTLCGENINHDKYTSYRLKEPKKQEKKIVLPPQNANARRVFAYLMKTRGIDRDIISNLMKQGKIYESKELFAEVQISAKQYERVKLIDRSTFVDLQYNNSIVETKEFQKGPLFGLNHEGKYKYAGVLKLTENILSEYIKNNSIKNLKEVHNCVFVGFDENENIKYASMRSITANSNFRQDVVGSDKQYGFLMPGISDEIYAFEAPIDAMSHATLFKLCGLDWKSDYRISLGGVYEGALNKFLEQHPYIKKITFCLDNDITGRNNVYGVYSEQKEKYEIRSLLKQYKEKGYEVNTSFPVTKDYNNDLMVYYREHKEENKKSENYEDMVL